MTNPTIIKSPILKKWWFWVIVFFLIIIIFSLNNDVQKENGNIQNNQSQTNQQTENYSNAFKLASVEIGYNNPPEELISKFDNLLKDLIRKCSEKDENQIANYIYKTKTMIEEKGIEITFLQAGNGINGSIPEEAAGVMSCAEVASLFVVLTTSQ